MAASVISLYGWSDGLDCRCGEKIAGCGGDELDRHQARCQIREKNLSQGTSKALSGSYIE
jgi:hypothetical protein